MPMIKSLEDAQRVFGALTYNDLETVKKLGGDRPDWSDGDGFVRWAGEAYCIEECYSTTENPDFGIGWTPGWCWNGCLWKWDGIEGKSTPPPHGPPPPDYFVNDE